MANGSEVVDRVRLERLQTQHWVFNPDENARMLQGILVSVNEACPQSANFARVWRRERAPASAAGNAAFIARANDELDSPNILVLDELATPYGWLRNRSGGTIPCI